MPTLADHFSNLVKQKTQGFAKALSFDQQAQIDALEKFANEMSGPDFKVVLELHPTEPTMALFFIDSNSPVGELHATIPFHLKKQPFGYRHSIEFKVSPSLTQNGPAAFDLTDSNECVKAAELLTDEVVMQMRDVNRTMTVLDYVDTKAIGAGPTGP